MFGKKAAKGKHAPDFTLSAINKGTLSLSDFKGKPVLLTFVRSSGWASCRVHLVQLRQKYEEITNMGGEVLAVAADRVEPLATLAKALKITYPVLADPLQTTYKIYDLIQRDNVLGGDFVLDKEGVIVYAHRGVTPEDRPPQNELMAAMHQAAESKDGS